MGPYERLKEMPCAAGELLIMWIGQAGFVMKNSEGKILAVDVYLSDLAMKQDGNKRMMPAIVTPEELKTNLILASHSHTDHLDLESLPVMLEEQTKLYCSEKSYELCMADGLPEEKITAVKAGDVYETDGYQVEAVFADHGDTSPDAVGFLIRSEDIQVYFTGDTSYQCDRMKPVAEKGVDVLLVPINGEYGNMNENDAAMLMAQMNAGLTVPCHFWTFIRHEGNPYKFLMAAKMTAPENEAYVMAPREIIRYRKDGSWKAV